MKKIIALSLTGGVIALFSTVYADNLSPEGVVAAPIITTNANTSVGQTVLQRARAAAEQVKATKNTMKSAENETRKTQSTTPLKENNSTKVTLTSEQKAAALACIQTAVVKREGGILTAITAFSNSMIAAFTTRSTAISAAYASGKASKDIRTDVKAAFTTWRATMKTARDTLKTSRRGARTTYRSAVKVCKGDNDIKAILHDDTENESGEMRSAGIN